MNDKLSAARWLHHDAIGWQATVLLFGDQYEPLAGELEVLVSMRGIYLRSFEADEIELNRLQVRRAAGSWTAEDQAAGMRLCENLERCVRLGQLADEWRQQILLKYYAV